MLSTMKACISLVMFLLASVSGDSAGQCDMAGFYQELGCTPVEPAATGTDCPTNFECPNLHPDPTMCYYKGEAYGDKSVIPQNLVDNPCMQACSCSVKDGEPAFHCAAIDCVESFGADMVLQCMKTYELDACCSTGNICVTTWLRQSEANQGEMSPLPRKDASSTLSTCEVEGTDRTTTFREGELFQPLNYRKTCLCTPQWNGTVNDIFCRDINCGLELTFQNELLQNCAPVFPSNLRDCPINFVCPSATSKVSRGLNIEGLVGECLFGNMTLAIGDEVSVDEECLKCTCTVPPSISCIWKSGCKSSIA